MGTPDRGLKSGRKIDLAFKQYCTTRQVPPGCLAWVKRRIAAIQVSLKKAKISVTASNVFVKLGQLKTHIDGTGIYLPTGETVVLELKSTTSSLADHRKAYDVPCSMQPTIKLGSSEATNTERLHHAIQLAFGVHALQTATRGYVIVSASDGAALYPLNRGIPMSLFSSAVPAKHGAVVKVGKTAQSKKPSLYRKCRWPGAKIALPGWEDYKKVTASVWMVKRQNTVALATAAHSNGGRTAAAKRLKATRAKLDAPPSVLLISVPVKRRWICHRIPI